MTSIVIVMIAFYSLILGLMQLGNWKFGRDWNRLCVILNERRERRVLRDFIMAYEDGLPPEAMLAVYHEALGVLTEFPGKTRAKGG